MKINVLSNWHKCRLGDLCSLVCSGGTPKSNVSEYYDGGIPWLNTKEVNFNRIYSTERTISELGLNNSAAKWIYPNTVIVAMYGATAGKVAIAKCKLTTNQACCNLSLKPDVADYQFVYYTLLNRYEELSSLANGGAQQNLNAQIIKDFEIDLPTLQTQHAISHLLGCLDSKIEQNAKINQNLKQQAQAIFKSWFVDFEPFQDGRFVDSELGPIPEGWRVTEMGDVTTEKRAKVGKQILKVFSAVNIGELKLSEDYFTKQVFSKDIGKYIVVEPLSFAYNPARINIGSIGINDMGYVGCVSPVYVVFSAENGYHHFINFLIKRPSFKEELKTRSSGSVRQSLGYKDFGLIKTIYPPHSIIEQFNKVYEPILGGIKHNLAENTKLIILRDTLLPKLMSGEIDVSEVDV